MTLQRKAIRKAVAAALRGRTYAGANVEEGAPSDYRPSIDGPAALYVHTLTDVAREAGRVDSGRIDSRDLELAVDVWIEEGTLGQRREDLMDDLCGQVEIVVGALLPNLSRLLLDTGADSEELDSNPSRSGFVRCDVGFDNRGRALLAAARVVFSVCYPAQDDPEHVADIVPLDGATVTWDFPPPDGLLEARDEIPRPEG